MYKMRLATRQHRCNVPELGKSSFNLSSELIRVFGSALRVPERHWRTSEDMLKKKIKKDVLNSAGAR